MKMVVVNSDGSVPEMCGNGIRCLIKFAKDIGVVGRGEMGRVLEIETGAGVLEGEILGESGGRAEVRVDMGEGVVGEVEGSLKVWGKEWTWTEVSTGNPHCVVFVDDDDVKGRDGNKMSLEEIDMRLEEIGRLFECNERFPNRTNTHFVRMKEDGKGMKVVVWERGAGRTMACGTGACACAVASIATGRAKRNQDIEVELPGGVLTIRWKDDDRIFMSGPGEFVFEGELPIKVGAMAGSAV